MKSDRLPLPEAIQQEPCQPNRRQRVIVSVCTRSNKLETASLPVKPATAAAAAENLPAESLDTFLLDVQARALAMSRFATGSTDEALDLVQDAMFAFVQAYPDKPPGQRRPLFFRCLNNRIMDWHRKRVRRGRWMLPWTPATSETADGPDPAIASAPSTLPDQRADQDDFGDALDQALRALPLRQRQVFLLRAWEGMDVAQTATALKISDGSVKTHYFRALAALRTVLEPFDE